MKRSQDAKRTIETVRIKSPLQRKKSIAIKNIAQHKRYLQHKVTTELYTVRLCRQVQDVRYVCRRYHISKADAVEPTSHRPKTLHSNAYTEEKLTWIRDLYRRNPNISLCEMYGKLREEKAYHRHPGSLYHVFVRLGIPQEGGINEKEIESP